MKKYLVKESSDWADEFDIEGFKIIEAESEEKVEEKLIDGRKFPCELYFGTNEAQEYETKEELLNDVEIVEISEEEVKVFEKFFGNLRNAFGTTAIL
jgi:hypothetical protein